MKKSCNSIAYCKEHRVTIFEKEGFSILECNKCSFRFIQISDHDHLTTVYSDEYFFGGKEGPPRKRINVGHVLFFYEDPAPKLAKPVFNFLNRLLGRMPVIYPRTDLKWYIFQKL